MVRYLEQCPSYRPCEVLDCRYSLVRERAKKGLDDSISCAIDVSADGPKGLRDIAQILGVNHSYIQAVEKRALAILAASLESGVVIPGESEAPKRKASGER